MPSGLINRLIVRLSGMLKEDQLGNDLIWRDGAILQQNGCTALVVQDKTEKGLQVIDISVQGKEFERKDLLVHIRRTLTGIHRDSFEGLDFEELVPCCCEACAGLPEPTFFEMTKLQRYIESGRTKIICDNEKSVQDVSIVQLLEGVVDSRAKDEMRIGDRQMEERQIFAAGKIDRIEDKLDELLEQAKHTERNVTNIYGPVGAMTETGDVNQSEVQTEKKNGKKPFLKKTSIIISIAAGLLAILTGTGIWQFFFKSEKAEQEPQTVKQQVVPDSTVSQVGQKAAEQDTTSPKTAGKPQ